MAKILIVGDSQSVKPGQTAEKKLKSQGHQTKRVSNVGKGPYDYVRLPEYWLQYTRAVASFNPDLIVLLFGSNDAPNQHLNDALKRLKSAVKPKVILSGPPRYPDPETQAKGEKIQSIYAEVFGEDYFDSYPHTSEELKRSPDKLHFTSEGAAPWGNAVATEVLRRLSST